MHSMWIKQLIVAVSVFLIMDFLWLSVIAKKLYIEQLGGFLNLSNGNISPNYLAAIIVYCALIAGIFLFVLPQAHSALSALYYGFLFGIITYSIYDFTNLAVIAKWPVMICLIDVAWGGVLCGITSFVTALIKFGAN